MRSRRTRSEYMQQYMRRWNAQHNPLRKTAYRDNLEARVALKSVCDKCGGTLNLKGKGGDRPVLLGVLGPARTRALARLRMYIRRHKNAAGYKTRLTEARAAILKITTEAKEAARRPMTEAQIRACGLAHRRCLQILNEAEGKGGSLGRGLAQEKLVAEAELQKRMDGLVGTGEGPQQ